MGDTDPTLDPKSHGAGGGVYRLLPLTLVPISQGNPGWASPPWSTASS